MTKDNAEKTAYSFIIRPNRSLSPTGMVYCFIALALMPLLIGVGFFVAGAWLVLPFAGLEVLVVVSVLAVLLRHSWDCEWLSVNSDTIRLQQQDGDRVNSYEFSRYWSRIILLQSPGRWNHRRLVIRSHGKDVEFGAGMTEQEKQTLAEALKPITGLAF